MAQHDEPATETEPAPGAGRADRRVRRWEWLALLLLTVLFLTNVLAGARTKSAVTDEPLYLLYGRLFLSHELAGVHDLSDGKGAVPALAALSVEAGRKLAERPDEVDELFWGRLPSAALGAALLVALWALARWLGGRGAGLLAAWLVAWDPNLIAHSKWITFDIAASLGFVLGVFAIAAYLGRPTASRAAAVIAALGAAQLTKASNLFLLVLLAGFALVDLAWRQRHGLTEREALRLGGRHLGVLVACGLFTVVLLNTVYGSWGRWQPLAAMALPPAVARSVLGAGAAARVPVPLPADYVWEVAAGIEHNRRGHPAYFRGHHRTHGWLLYFPAALVLKATLPLLLLLALAVALRLGGWIETRGRDAVVAGAAAALLLYFMFEIHVNIGVRYVLPVYALAVALAASSIAAARGGRRRLVVAVVLVLAGWHAVESVKVFPNHLSYFNQLAGGPDGGWRWLNDSNLSWGQDTAIVERWLRKQREPVAVNPTEPTPGLVVVSANFLTGLSEAEARRTAWLRENYEPVAYVTPAYPVFRIPDDARFRRIARGAP